MLATTRNKVPGGVMFSALAVLGAGYLAPGFVKGVGLLRAAGSTSNSEDPQLIRVYVGLGGSKLKTLLRSLDASTAAQKLHHWASGLVPAKDKIVYGCNSSTCETVTVDSLLQGRMRNEKLGTILPPGIEEIQLVAGSPYLLEEMPGEHSSIPEVDGEWSFRTSQMRQIREALGINAEDLNEDRYAAVARKKYNLSGAKLEGYLAHLRTQAEEHLGHTLAAIGKEKDPAHQRKVVNLVFAWRNLNGSEGWEGFPGTIRKSKLIEISVDAIMALLGRYAQAIEAEEIARGPRRFVPSHELFQFLCNSYGLLGGEFRDALKSAWATAPEENRTPAQVFRELTELVEKELSLAGAHNIMSEEHFACSRRATLERLARAKDAQALAASHLEDLEAMASGVEAGGPVRFFGLVGGFGFFDGLKTETRVGWSQKALDDFADQYASEEYQNDYNRVRHGINRKGGQPLYRANRKGGQSQSIVGEASLPEGKSKFEQLVLKQLRSDMAMTVKDIKTAEKWLNKGR